MKLRTQRKQQTQNIRNKRNGRRWRKRCDAKAKSGHAGASFRRGLEGSTDPQGSEILTVPL